MCESRSKTVTKAAAVMTTPNSQSFQYNEAESRFELPKYDGPPSTRFKLNQLRLGMVFLDVKCFLLFFFQRLLGTRQFGACFVVVEVTAGYVTSVACLRMSPIACSVQLINRLFKKKHSMD